MKGNFLLGLGVGILAAYLWKQMNAKSKKNPTDLTIKEAVAVAQQVAEEEANKFGSALRQEYDIVMIPNKYTEKVKRKAKELTEGRYAIKVDNINPSVSL